MTNQPMRIQVIDDHPMIAKGLASELAGPAIEFLEPAQSVAEADPTATVVICDLMLRDEHLSGAAAVRFLRGEHDLAVLATSGVGYPNTIADAFAAGAYSFVSKEGFVEATWRHAIAATAARSRYITSRLADALLADARSRVLPAEQELASGSVEFLRTVLRNADSPFSEHFQDWKDPRVATAVDRIWRTTRTRSDRYTITISDRLRAAAPGLRAGRSQKEVARALGISYHTLRGDLTKLQQAFQERHADLDSSAPLKGMTQTALLHHLLEIEQR